MNRLLANRRAVVRLADGRTGILVFWPKPSEPGRGARVMLGGPRSSPVAPADVVEILVEATRPSRRRAEAA